MRKLAVYPHAGTLVGGSTHAAVEMAKFLRTHGWEIVHVFPGPGPGADLAREAGFRVQLMGLSERDIVTLRNTNTLPKKVASILPQLKSTAFTMRWVNAHRPALVHIHDDRSVFAWGLAAKRAGIPVIWHVHQRSGNALLDRIRLRLVDYVIYIAEDTKSRFRDYAYLPPGTVIYNPVDTTRFRPPANKAQVKRALGLPDDVITIGYVGNFVARKRPEWLIHVVEILCRKGLPVFGVIVGADLSGGTYSARLKQLMESSGYAKRFAFLGYQPNVERVMQALDVLLLPSVAEPFGRVVIEAMACGAAVVATRAGGVPEIVRDGVNGFLVSPNSIQEMVDRTHLLCINRQLRERLAETGRKTVESRFSHDAALGELLRVYAQLIS